MICIQALIYTIYVIIQTLILIHFFEYRFNLGYLFLDLVFIGIIYLLCEYKYYSVANVLVGISIIYSLLVTDLYSLVNKNFANTERKTFKQLGMRTHAAQLRNDARIHHYAQSL